MEEAMQGRRPGLEVYYFESPGEPVAVIADAWIGFVLDASASRKEAVPPKEAVPFHCLYQPSRGKGPAVRVCLGWKDEDPGSVYRCLKDSLQGSFQRHPIDTRFPGGP